MTYSNMRTVSEHPEHIFYGFLHGQLLLVFPIRVPSLRTIEYDRPLGKRKRKDILGCITVA